MYTRKRSHWCLHCMDSLFNGTLYWGLDHTIESRVVSSIGESEEHVYCFEKSMCFKTASPGVALKFSTMTRDSNEIASMLTPGDFILFDASEDELEPL